MRLKDTDSEFDRELGERWSEYVDSCLRIPKDYNFTMEQKLQSLHNVLSTDALRFYLDAVQPHATTFKQAVAMNDQEYNSPVCQNRVKNYLTSLRVREFVGNGMEVSTRLSKVYKLTLKLFGQVPPLHPPPPLSLLTKEVLIVLSSSAKLSRYINGLMSFFQELPLKTFVFSSSTKCWRLLCS